ncbi:MAG: class I SAM-dependent rRNA methyltransferase, partial [Bacteroidia bacterium]
MPHPILQLKPKRDKAILHRHPWIFSGALAKTVQAEEGDIVEVQSHEGKTLGYGFYSAKSQISCRMFEWSDTAPDFDSVDYWKQKIHRAFYLRDSQVISSRTNVYRLIHAEGDFLPGIIIDIYGNVAVAQILIKGIEKRKALLQQALYALGFENVYIKAKSSSHVLEDIEAQSGWLSGAVETPVKVLEHNLQFEVDFIEGQKTGFFIDQRENRALLRTFSQGKKVLNTFSYTGGFSVYALAGGAELVHSVDISADALAVCDRNVLLNFPHTENHKSIVA